MRNLNNLPEFQELSAQEKITVNGGESFWYWSAYYLGKAGMFVKDAVENPPTLPGASEYK